MRYPWVLYVKSADGLRVTVRSFKTEQSRQRAIRQLPEGTNYEVGEQLTIGEWLEPVHAATFDTGDDIPY